MPKLSALQDWETWKKNLDVRCERRLRLTSLLPTQRTETISKVLEYLDPAAPALMQRNLREYDILRKHLLARCGHCGYVISDDPKLQFEAAGFGPVCSLCHDMHASVNWNSHLRDPHYFRKLHEAWEKEKKQIDKNRGGVDYL